MRIDVLVPEAHVHTVQGVLGLDHVAVFRRSLATYSTVARAHKASNPFLWVRKVDGREFRLWQPDANTSWYNTRPVNYVVTVPEDYFGNVMDVETYKSDEFGHSLKEMFRIGLAILAQGVGKRSTHNLVRNQPSLTILGMGFMRRNVYVLDEMFAPAVPDDDVEAQAASR